MTDTLDDATEPSVTERILTLLDRCDRCISQAFVRVTFKDGLLDFCGHHYHVNREALALVAVDVIDERQFIDA